MPRVVTLQTKAHDPRALGAACRRLGLPPPVLGEVRLRGEVARGYLVELPGSPSPAVLDTLTGLLRYLCEDGEQFPNRHLRRFLRAYAAEKLARLARLNSAAWEGLELSEALSELLEMEVP